MKRKFYVKPNTRLFSVELEETFAGSAEVKNPNSDTGLIERKEYNADFNDITFTNTWGEGE